MPSSCAARTTRRSASTPRRWPSPRGRPRAAAQRPFPSMMIATWRGTSAGLDAGASEAVSVGTVLMSDCHDLLFLGGEQLVDLGDLGVGRLLHITGKTGLVVLGDLVVLF